MINETMQATYERWCSLAVEDEDVVKELQQMKGDPKALEDAFYKELSFGTGGLRGVIGAGPNQLNIYTIGKASQGLARYIVSNFPKEQWSIAVSYDSRIKSDIFAKRASEVFSAAGLQVYLYPQLMPTPCLSFAVRELGCVAGVMVTASHNPSKYNGYKVYGADGCQITTAAAKAIYKEIQAADIFTDVERIPFEDALAGGQIRYIDSVVEDAFIEAVKAQSLLTEDVSVNKDVAIIYSPLNGTGLKPVMRTLQECGYTNITVVKEQEQPDGHFPTCPKPNPEVREAMELGLQYARKHQADLLLATDPDCDRVG
ncbi:MAG: phospho-sugar mutase, partial [Lachnospiraceae bacterium]|nr:phospho-sugar mutase [Lachnospiraceae bacterium]